MLSEGSPNVNRLACGKKIRKINKQFLYHRDPMCDIGAKQGFSQHTAEVSSETNDKWHDMTYLWLKVLTSTIFWEIPCLARARTRTSK